MKKLFFLTILIIHFCIFNLIGQSSSAQLHGVINDGTNNESLIGAFVIIEGTSFGTATDYEGKYVINNIPEGNYQVKVSYIGYDDQLVDIILVGGEKKELDIDLVFSGIQLGAVEVTAQAKGQMSAINEQLNGKSIKNVVSAERIQELPDANAAETISRLPGVSVQRTGGEGNKVVVRGLSPKYTKVMIEGVSMASSGADRSSDISMISPYSLDGIELLKAVTADKDADFIGGAINFKLRSADPGMRFNLIAQGGYNGLKSTATDYMVVASASNRFFKDKLGLYLQANIESRNRSSNEQGAGYRVKELDTIHEVHTQNLKLSDVNRYVDRKGVTAVLDYKIKNGSIHFKNFFSNGNTNVTRYSEYFDLSSSNRIHRYETRKEEYDVNSLSNFISYEQQFGAFSIEANLSNSTSKRDVPTNFGFVFVQPNAIKSEVLNKIIPPYELLDYATIDDEITYLDNMQEFNSITEEKQQAVTLDFKYDFTINKNVNGSIKMGGKYRYKNRSNDKTVYTGRFRLNSGQQAKDAILKAYPEMQKITPIGSTSLPYVLFRDNEYDHGDFLDGEYSLGGVAPSDLMENVKELIKNNVTKDEFQTYSKHEYYSTREDYKGQEYLTAAYTMAEINLGPKWKFIPGVRYEKNRTVYTAPRGDATKSSFPDQDYRYKDETVTRDNSFVLPMIHLKYSPVEWVNIRGAYTHTLSRPSYYQFAPRIDILQEAVIYNNATLVPEYSKNIDLYVSFHANKLGLLTIGGFTKSIDNMIFGLNRRVILDPTEYDLPEAVKNNDIYTQANNQDVAIIRGIELDWQTSFWYLDNAFKGLVFNVNYTHIYSSAQYPRTVVESKIDPVTFKPTYTNIDSKYEGQLVQQPDDIFNIQLGYDYKGFSARISTLYQSRIFQGANFYDELVKFTDVYNRWDVSLKQKLPWYNLQVYCNLNNITSSGDRDLIAGAPWNTKIQHYGSSIDLGMRIELK